jgi:glycyl-tRNA synthetase beta chain
MEQQLQDLLVEIGTEELPPTALRRLAEAFSAAFREQLDQAHLAYSDIESFATPRRLAILVRDLASRQPDQKLVRKGPALRAAYDADGQPTKAALGFARSCGVTVADLNREETSKGAWLVFRQNQPGRSTADMLVAMVQVALDALPIPKRMRWGDRDDEFVRPVHWVTILFGQEQVPGTLFGIRAGRETYGHRFHHPQAISIPRASDYATVLRTAGNVEPDFDRRKTMIRDQVRALAADGGGEAILDDDLLNEVTALCEWPTALMGDFDAEFLEVPPEVLVETMQKHQKYFPLVDGDGLLQPRFITVSNIESSDPDQVRGGNERVIRPRFSDAAFFWEQDRKQPLAAFAPALERVVFQERLGTLAEKSARVGQIARHVAGLLGVDEELASRSAQLAKCDLMTQMIFEFASLQGLMGRYYAQGSGEDECVAAAMEEQYLPRHAGDALPQSDCGRVLAVADKLDTLVGIFAIGQRPTGVKDPYALRRAAIGLLRILIETPLPLDLKDLLEFTAEELRDKVDAGAAASEVFDYSMDRLLGYYQDQDIGSDVVESVLAVTPTVPSDIHRRIIAVKSFASLPEAESLTAANKRIRNILRKSGESRPGEVVPGSLREEAEKRLADRVTELDAVISPLLHSQDYTGVLKALSGLREDVDAFFDEIMVMVDDAMLRRNRLALLRSLEALFLRVADISRLQ